MGSSGSGFALTGMFLLVYHSSCCLDRLHGHLLMENLSVEGVGDCVVEDNFDLDADLAESIRLAEDSFAGEGHGTGIQHGKAIVVATSYEWVIYFSLDSDKYIFSNQRTHDSFHEAMGLRIHHDVVDNPVVPKMRSGCQLVAACLVADSRDSLGCSFLDLSNLVGVNAFESVTRNVSENVRDEESGHAQLVRYARLWNLPV